MNDEDEIRQIMREALDRLKDQALADMSASDRRVVSIAQAAGEPEIQRRLAVQRSRLLVWPLMHAMAGCLILAVVFMAGVLVSLSGQTLGSGAALLAVLGLAAIPVPVAQIISQAGRR